MGSHFTKVCEFGKSHGTCRCASTNKPVITVPCDRPGEHNKTNVGKPVASKPTIQDYMPLFPDDYEQVEKPKTLRERMHETLGEAFSDIISESKVEAILDTLEQDVKDWLLDNANKL